MRTMRGIVLALGVCSSCAVALGFSTVTANAADSPRIVGYYGAWDAYRGFKPVRSVATSLPISTTHSPSFRARDGLHLGTRALTSVNAEQQKGTVDPQEGTLHSCFGLRNAIQH